MTSRKKAVAGEVGHRCGYTAARGATVPKRSRLACKRALGLVVYRSLARHTTNSASASRFPPELRGRMSLECCLLQLLDLSRLAGSHLFNELLESLDGGLANLYELHGRRINPLRRTLKSHVGRKIRPELQVILLQGRMLECAQDATYEALKHGCRNHGAHRIPIG